MATMKTTIYIHRYQGINMDAPCLMVMTYKSSDPEVMLVESREIEVELRDANYIPERVSALRTKVSNIYAEASQEAAVIEDKIQKLLCLENTNPKVDEPVHGYASWRDDAPF